MKSLQISNTDLLILLLLTLFQIGLGIFISWKNRGAENYFAGGRALKWTSIAGSIFGTNVSALHLVGMLGIGYSVGFAQSHFELLAVFPIVVLAFVFIPLYRKIKIFTLSEFLEVRFNAPVRLTYSIMMMLLILVQMVGSFYIGARAIMVLTHGSSFPISYEQGILLQALVICSYTMFGGLRAVMVTESFQTIFIIGAATALAWLTFSQPEIDGFFGLLKLDASLPETEQKMHLFFPTNHSDFPWTGVLTGLMVLHFFYWNTNQFIVQRVIAAETDKQAQIGVLVSGFLKIAIIPFLTIVTGIAAAHLFKARLGKTEILPDDVFLYLVDEVVPKYYGFTGLILAGVAAAVFSTIDAMMNAATTLFTVDVYKKYIKPTADEKAILLTGRVTVIIMAVLASVMALYTYDPNGKGNFFLTVASRGSYFTPGIIVAFFGGILFPKASMRGALWAILIAPFFAFSFEWFYNEHLVQVPEISAQFGEKLNFLHRIFVTFLGSLIVFIALKNNQEELTTEKQNLLLDRNKLKTILWRTAVFLLTQGTIAFIMLHNRLESSFAGIIALLLTLPLFFLEIAGKKIRLRFNVVRLLSAFLIAITMAILFWFW